MNNIKNEEFNITCQNGEFNTTHRNEESNITHRNENLIQPIKMNNLIEPIGMKYLIKSIEIKQIQIAHLAAETTGATGDGDTIDTSTQPIEMKNSIQRKEEFNANHQN